MIIYSYEYLQNVTMTTNFEIDLNLYFVMIYQVLKKLGVALKI